MTRIILSSLAVAVILATAPITPAAAGQSLSGGQQTTSCDCSNCSAEHCQPPRTGSTGVFTITFGGSLSEPPKTPVVKAAEQPRN